MAVDGHRSGKINLGLSVKFEAKVRKVIVYSRKTDRYWEFSQTTVALIKEYKVTGANMLQAGLLIFSLV
jgi:5'-3' exoribonuclease 1